MSDSQLQEGVLLMPKELYKAAMTGDFEFIENTVIDEYLLRKTCTSNNIMHIAIRHESMFFVRKALLRVPQLMWSPNVDGNTPFHVAAEMGDEELVIQICEEITDLSLLRMKNSTGNTPLHVALIHTQLEVARTLVQKDPGLASIINVSAEAPLHLAIKYFPQYNYDTDHWSNWKIRRCMRSLEEKRKNWDEGYFVIEEETMVSLIVLLLEIASYVTCWRDESGLTPLHRAASLNKSINVAIIAFMIECWPQCIEVCDNSGKTILHHLINRIVNIKDGKDFLTKTHMHSLKNHQDNDGNTPSHLAVRYSDFIIAELLSVENFNANWLLKNKKGLSVDICINQSDMIKMMEGETSMLMAEETCRTVECEDMFTLREHQEKIGEVRFFKSRDSKGSSVVHKLLLRIKQGCIILPEEFLNFLEEVLGDYPELLGQPDNKGDTPIHVLAQLNPSNIMIHLADKVRNNSNTNSTLIDDIYSGPNPDDPKYFEPPYSNYYYVWERLENTSFFIELIDLCLKNFKQEWLTLNEKGNTALHEAILAENYQVFAKLAYQFPQAVTLVNKRNETVLHLLATLKSMHSIEDVLLYEIILNNTRYHRELLDDEGLSPIMRAIRAGNIRFAEKLCFFCPRLAKAQDSKGQTFWHLLVNESQIESCESLDLVSSSFKVEVVCRELETRDKNRKTPLHLAIERRRFDLAQAFIELHGSLESNEATLLKIPNSEGITPADLIADLTYVPPQFGKVCTKLGIQSKWGISPTQIKDYVNTMGVIAALLTTITFTAAFTVPGGSDQEKGTPLLIKDLAFQIFIISDILAMCLSMAVLFCLLWIMANDKKSEIMPLLDFSIILLRASFYMTLVTFMAGLYTTTYSVISWVAIVALVLCSMLLLLMHQCLVKTCMIPCVNAVLNFLDKAFQPARRLCKHVLNFLDEAFQLAKDLYSNRLKIKWRQRSSQKSELPLYSNRSTSD